MIHIDPQNLSPGPDDLFNARRAARLNIERAAAIAGRTPLTIHRQESGNSPVDLALYRLFLTLGGWSIEPAWNGWKFFQGCFWSPEGDSFEPGDLYGLFFLRQANREKDRYIRELEMSLYGRRQQSAKIYTFPR